MRKKAVTASHESHDHDTFTSQTRFKPIDWTAYFANRLNGCSVSVPIAPKPPSDEQKAKHLSQNRETAEVALEYYNKKHGTQYMLVDPIVSCGALTGKGIWYHCNFTAKSEASDGSCEDSSTKVFFAEMKVANRKGFNRLLVTACRPLDRNNDKTTQVCEMCVQGGLVHPLSGFRQGLYPYQCRALRPRSDGKVVSKTMQMALGELPGSKFNGQ